jgi:small subunit ribosomal protein S17
MAKKKKTEETVVEETQAEAVAETVEETVKAKAEEAVEEVKAATEKPKKAKKADEPQAEATEAKKDSSRGNRAQRIGVVTSDKMTKTVVVRVDRLIKHPKYRRYVRRKKQFMAHDELGSTIGDKVKIVETRPLSARKRWRVVEIVQKAAK